MIYDNGVFSLPSQADGSEAKGEVGGDFRGQKRVPTSPWNSKGGALITLINISREVWRFARDRY